MRRFLLAAPLVLLPALAFAQEPPQQPKLTFTIDGKDLIISTTVTANNSPHVAWTHVVDTGKDVYLYYHVIQNRDLLVRGARSVKQVELKWKLAGAKPAEKVYHVQEKFNPNTAELKELLPQLQKLTEGGKEKPGEK